MKKICTICGKEFTRSHNSNKYCSTECKKKAWSIANKRYQKTSKGRICHKRYCKTFKGKSTRIKAKNKRRALKRNCIHEDYSSWLKEVKSLKNFTCHWCNEVFSIDKLHIDHVVPLSKGGIDTKDNVVCACSSCNNKKYTKLPEEFNSTLDQPLLLF